MVWVWGSLSVGWGLGDGRGVGVPGGVSSIGASLVDTGGLVGVGAVVGLWGWGGSLEPSPAVKAEELVLTSLLNVHIGEVLEDLLVVVLVGLGGWDLLTELVVLRNSDWDILVESDGGSGSNKGSNGELHLQILKILL